MNFFLIGKFVRPVGLKGEMRTEFYVDSPDELEAFSSFYVKDQKSPGGYRKVALENINERNGRTFSRIKGLADINLVEPYKGVEIYADEAEMPAPEPGKYYIKELMGLPVEWNGKPFGTVYNVVEIAASFMLVIRLTDGKDLVVPFNETFIEFCDPAAKIVRVRAVDQLL